ncbi:DUF3265 domain-containing protein [Vibrio parahaemolyticus]|nr:DUF3265 domain-containing protein [Vibrio parahaemolyticus]
MRNAWHFYHALIFVIMVLCGNIVLRCSPLKRALADTSKPTKYCCALILFLRWCRVFQIGECHQSLG